MIITFLTQQIDDCVSVADLGAGTYEVRLRTGVVRQATQQEIAAAEAAESARIAAEQQAAADKAELRAQFQAAYDRLVQIRGAAGTPTAAQMAAAIKDMAGYQIKMLRALYGILS